MKRVLFFIGLLWRPVLTVTILLAASLTLLTYKLGSLVPGYSQYEIGYLGYVTNSSVLPAIPVYWPVLIINKAVLAITSPTILNLRYVSVALGLVSVVGLLFVVRSWQSQRVALMGGLLALTSSWFLLNARAGLPTISVTLLILLVGCTVWMQRTNKHKLTALLAAISVGFALYIPGAIWLLLIGIIWKRKYIMYEARNIPFWYALVCVFAVAAMFVPGFIRITNVDFLASLAGLPTTLSTIKDFPLNVARFIGALFWNSSLLQATSIGSQSILDYFSIAMFFAGVIASIRRRDESKQKLVIGWLLVGLLLIGLGGSVPVMFVFIPIMLIVAQGIAWTLQQWFAVFPKNPVARNTGLILMIVVVALSATYNTYRYFVAWPHMDSTKSNYNQTY